MTYKYMTLEYAIIQLFFGILTSSLIGFTTLYLNSKGIESINIGIFISLCNISVIGFSYINKILKKILKNKNIIDLAVIFCLVGIISLVFDLFQKINIFILVFLFFPYLYSIAIQTTINTISGFMYNKGIRINFGLAKVFCSIAFSLNTIFLSKLISFTSENAVIYLSIFSYLFLILVLKSIPKEILEKDEKFIERKDAETKSIRGDFYIFLIAYGLLCAYHFMKTTYMIDIIEYNKGNVMDLGKVLSLGSISEIPILLLFSKIERKFGARILLLISSLFFLIQFLTIGLSENIIFIYLSAGFQGLAFGLLIPSAVYYVNESFDISLNEKGQSLLVGASSIGTIISTSFAGFVMTYFKFSSFLWAGFGFCLLGFLIFLLVLKKDLKERA